MSICPKCNSEFIPTEKWGHKTKYCSRKCANSHNVSETQKQKVSKTMLSKYPTKPEIVGPFTRIYKCKCKYSGQIFYSKTPKQIHPNLARNKQEYTYSCQFRFGISSYSNWFTTASELINQYGWYSTPGSRKGIKNVNGISRDHLFSITDGWLHNLPPEIIRHPANCDLVPHTENQKKHKKSKITLEELYQRISEFNTIYGDPIR